MSYIPQLYTPRLRLRPFTLADAARVQQFAGDERIAATTLRIPHPYPLAAAEAWIRAHQHAAALGKAFDFAITLAGTRTPGREQDVTDTGHLVGAVGLALSGDPLNGCAELGYWIGVPYWRKGFATEAAGAVIDFGFSRRGYNRILARHFADNLASGRVLQKLGMLREGLLRQQERKNDHLVDVAVHGLLYEEWAALRQTHKRLLPRTRREHLPDVTLLDARTLLPAAER